MKVEEIKICDLKPFEKNPRRNKSAVAQVAKSIEAHGFNQPLVIDQNNLICVGHTRYFAAKEIGMDNVPCYRKHMTELKFKAYNIADNKTNELAEWDDDILKDLFSDNDLLLDFHGFSTEELDDLLDRDGESNSGLADDDEVPDDVPPRSRIGDLYEIGNHRVLCGDSTDRDQADRLMGGEKATLMSTDPPYGVELDQSWRDRALGDKAMAKGNSNVIQNDNRADWLETYKLFNGDICYVWHATTFTDLVKKNLEDADFEVKQMIIWNKSVMVMGRSMYHWKHEPCWYCVRKGKTSNWQGDRKQVTVWDAASPNHIMSGSKDDKTSHPSQKPLVLTEIPIKNHTVKGNIIYDPFLGSGTTLIASEKTSRKCYGMELDPHYVDVIIQRWVDYTGIKDIKKNGNPIVWGE